MTIQTNDGQPAAASTELPRLFVHDLMNQLCTILGHSELLLDALADGNRAADDARAIRDACQKAIALTERWASVSPAIAPDSVPQAWEP